MNTVAAFVHITAYGPETSFIDNEFPIEPGFQDFNGTHVYGVPCPWAAKMPNRDFWNRIYRLDGDAIKEAALLYEQVMAL